MSIVYGEAVPLPGEHIKISTDPSTERFWEMAKQEVLTACQCGDCGHFRMPPTPFCPECQSKNVVWPELPGTARIFSFAICTHSPFPPHEPLVYVPAVVDLDGAPGARLVSNIVGVPAENVTIGMPVKVGWIDIQDDWKLPIFEPVENGS